MKWNMRISGAVLLVGIAIIGFYDPIEVEPEHIDASGFGGFGPVVIVPLGYFLAFAGAAGLVISWMRGPQAMTAHTGGGLARVGRQAGPRQSRRPSASPRSSRG